MAELVVRAGDRRTLVGLSTETKPTRDTTPGTFFEESDTGYLWVWTGSEWAGVQAQKSLQDQFTELNKTCAQILVELQRIRTGASVFLRTDLAEIGTEELNDV